MKTNAFSLAGIDLSDATPELLLQSAAELTSDEHAAEEYLRQQKAWFPYRRLDHVSRTVEFVAAFDRVYLSMIGKNDNLKPSARTFFRHRGHYLDTGIVMAPWAISQKKRGKRGEPSKLVVSPNPEWKSWLRSRRLADRHGMIYGDFVAGGLFSALRRGWSRWPTPSQLGSAKLLGLDGSFPDATIAGFERIKYEKSMKVTHDPYFLAAGWKEDALQISYLNHFRSELLRVRLGDQAARRAWRGYQEDGTVSSHIAFDDPIFEAKK